ncbi:MAG: hypothetical protein VKO39_06020 [Cyanobacteriota bacterium]|nr:hypothetical protein [Cyanobacteriota bacterium]
MTTNRPPSPPTVAALLAALEEISRGRPDRVLRLRGRLIVDAEGLPVDSAAAAAAAKTTTEEAFELLIFRGFSSSITHLTAFDPDRPALPDGAVIEMAELLAGPLNPLQEQRLAGPQPVEAFLNPAAWNAGEGSAEEC